MPKPSGPAVMDLLGGLDDEGPSAGSSGAAAGGPLGMDDLFGSVAAPPAAPAGDKVVLPGDRAEGMQIRNAFVMQNGKAYQRITIENMSQSPLSGFAIQYNKNSFGASPESPMALGQSMPPQLAPGQSHTGMVPLTFGGQLSDSKGLVQMAIKNNVKVFYFQDTLDVLLFLSPDGRIDRTIFLEQWKGNPNENRAEVSGLSPAGENVDAICPKLEASNVFFVARRKLPDNADLVYVSVKTLNGIVMLAEIGYRPGTGTCSIAIKAQQPQYVPLLSESLQKLLRARVVSCEEHRSHFQLTSRLLEASAELAPI